MSESPGSVIRRAAVLIREHPEKFPPGAVTAVAGLLDALGGYEAPADAFCAALAVARACLNEPGPAADEAGIEAVKRAGRAAWDKHHGGAS